jgi:hypothetical protein
MVDDWDKDEAAKDPRTYLTEEDSLKAICHMLEKYHNAKGIKLNPSSMSHSTDILIDSFIDTIFHDKEFHKFVLENYGLVIYYDEKNDRFYIRNP